MRSTYFGSPVPQISRLMDGSSRSLRACKRVSRPFIGSIRLRNNTLSFLLGVHSRSGRRAGRSTPFLMTIAEAAGIAETDASLSASEVTCRITFLDSANKLHKRSKPRLIGRFRAADQWRVACSAPRGDQTIGFLRLREKKSVGIVVNEYTPVRWTTSAHLIWG